MANLCEEAVRIRPADGAADLADGAGKVRPADEEVKWSREVCRAEACNLRASPSPGGGGSRAISALTRVCDSLWRAGWGDLLCQDKESSHHPGSHLATLDVSPPHPLQGRVKRVRRRFVL